MVSFNKSEIIKASPNEVYSFLSNFENAPKRSIFWKAVKLVKREDNCSTYETMEELEGRKLSSLTRVTNQPGQRTDAEIVDGDGKGSKLSSIIVSIPEGTKFTIQGEIVLPGFAQMLSGTAGKMLGGIVEARIEPMIEKELELIKKALDH